jgi:carbamoyltransferase
MKTSQYSASARKVFLGVTDSHDAGVVLIADGEILAAIGEERLNRRKMASGMPLCALSQIWDVAGVSPDEVVSVGVAGHSSAGAEIPINNDFSDDRGRYLPSQRVAELIDLIPGGRQLLASGPASSCYRATMPLKTSSRVASIRQHLQQFGVRAPIRTFDHHDAHIASAYYSAGRPNALVISNDGFGDGLCSKVAVGNSRIGGLEVLSENSFFNSIGVYYNFATLLCGFAKAHHAGKTTGLAAFGDPTHTLEVFQDLIRWHNDSGIYVNHGRIFRNCIADLRDRLSGASREDIAAGIQRHCEEVLTTMTRYYVERTQRQNVVLVGGVHANVKVNQKITEIPGLESVFVFPNMGDGGLALGGAYLAALNDGQKLQPSLLKHSYLGPTYLESEMLEAVTEAGLPFYRPEHYAREVAKLLAEEKVVARFDGAMEYGPRALGNRSILYSATKPEVNKWLNQQLNRTEFMPFAPVLREQDAMAFLENYGPATSHTAEFMTITYGVTGRCKREAPATVHVDGTARPQVVRREVNPGYHDILTEYNELTGLSVLVNTSFNMHEEPIVCTPQDAVRAFLDSNIDVLAMGPFIVTNPAREGRPGLESS